MTAWNDGLSGRQLEAAGHKGTHARLLAGPGTGKTFTLMRRVVKLVSEDGIPAENILALAFTRINVFDLRRNLANELATYEIPMPRISTLHSYALRQLLRNSELITSLPGHFRIADDYEEKDIIRPDIAHTLSLSDKQVREKFDELSSDWQSLVADNVGYQPTDRQFMGEWQEHRKVYGYVLRSELVWQLKHALEENLDDFDLEGDTQYLLVDEYQDLNRCDLAIIRVLAERGAEVFCTGDDDQGIYGFRRAHPAGIRRFLGEYQPSTPLELDICRRCDRAIITIGQSVADLDSHRLRKPLHPHDDASDGEVHLLRFRDEYEEAENIAFICKCLQETKGYKPEDILVLLRSDYQRKYSSVLEAALERSGLQVNTKVQRGGPMDEPAGRYLLCLIRLSFNDCDDLSWRTILHYARKGNRIGEETISVIYYYAVNEGLRFYEVLQRIENDPGLILRGKFVKEDIAAIRELMAQLADLVEAKPPDPQDEAEKTKAREKVLEGLSNLTETIVPLEEDRQLVSGHLRKIAEYSDATTLRELLNALTSPEDTLDQELEQGKTNILTMHRAKGLTVKAVIIVAAEEQLIPGDAAGEALGDERRLLYVSLTRAQHHLYITYCKKRRGRQKHSGSHSGNPRRTLTPFLRGAIQPESGVQYVASLSTKR